MTRAALMAATLLTMLLCACGGSSSPQPAPRISKDSPATSTTTTNSSKTPYRTALEGVWVGKKVTLRDIARVTSPAEARFILEANDAEHYMITTIRVTGDRWEMFVTMDEPADPPPTERNHPPASNQAGNVEIDDELIVLDDDHVTKVRSRSGPAKDHLIFRYHYELHSDKLHLDLIATNALPARGKRASERAFQLAHYELTPFTRYTE